MGQGVQIGGADCVANLEPFLAGNLKAGVVAFIFVAQCISALEVEAFSVNGKSVVVRDGFVVGAASVFLAVVPIKDAFTIPK